MFLWGPKAHRSLIGALEYWPAYPRYPCPGSPGEYGKGGWKVQVGTLDNEELASVGIGSGIGHGHYPSGIAPSYRFVLKAIAGPAMACSRGVSV